MMVERMLRPQALNKRSCRDTCIQSHSSTVSDHFGPCLHTHCTHLKLMSDRVAVSIKVEDQVLLLCDGAGVRGHATHTQTVLHLHTLPYTEDWCEAH